MSSADIRSERQARAILKLAADAPPSTWRTAFQREVKAAHPDRGGDTERVRLVIEAYRFLKALDGAGPGAASARPSSARRPRPEPPRPEPPHQEASSAEAPRRDEPPAQPDLSISIVEAFRGCHKTVRLERGKRFRVRLPPGLQSGDVVRFGTGGEHRLTIAVAPIPRAELKGADLWLTVAVSREFLRDGGRMEVETPFGPRKFWVSRTSAARGLYRAPHEGLPARGARPKGHLYLKFELDETLRQSPAKSLLARFAAMWGAA